MFFRLFSLVLISAVIACPLWCGPGIGVAGPCCSLGSSTAAASCEAQGIPDGCCQEHVGEPLPVEPECPDEFCGCQGICGGAVLARPVEVDRNCETRLLPLVDVDSPVSSGFAGSWDYNSDFHCRGSGKNVGRFMRTLHKSFLC